MEALYNFFDHGEVPAFFLCDPNQNQLFSLGAAYNRKVSLRYNAIGGLEFDYPQSIDNGQTNLPAFDFIHNKMVVLVDGIDYYIINECPVSSEGTRLIKHIVAQSLDSALLMRKLVGFSGTYNLYNQSDPYGTLLQELVDMLPSWSIGTVDSSLQDTYRTFDENDTTVYNFLISTVATTYNCIFEFDNFNKTISAKAIDTLNPPKLGISLSLNNLLKSVKVDEYADEMATALYCYGGEGLDIHSVNPLGSNIIYDFHYYKSTDWMSQDLIDSIDAWETKIDNYQLTYANTLTDLKTYSASMVNLTTDLTDFESQLTSLLGIYKVRKQQKLDTSEVEKQIYNQRVKISGQNESISDLQKIIDGKESSLRLIVHDLSFTKYLSFKDFYSDIGYMMGVVETITKNWNTIYNEKSKAPEFNLALYNAKLPTIVDLVNKINHRYNELTNYISIQLNTQPFKVNEDYIKYILDVVIEVVDGLYNVLQEIIPNTSITVSLSSLSEELKNYQEIIYLQPNFTDELFLDLSAFIYENSYTNENIIITDIMTEDEIQEQAQELYDESVKVLARKSEPRYELSGDVINFISLKEYEAFTKNLVMGGLLDIVIDENNIIEAAVLELVINYDDPTDFQMTLSNRARLNKDNWVLTDYLGSALSGNNNGISSTQISNITQQITQNITEGGGGTEVPDDTYLRLDATNDPVNGDLRIMPDVDSHTSFQVIESTGETPVFSVDNLNGQINVQAKYAQTSSSPMINLWISASTLVSTITSDDPTNLYMGVDSGINNVPSSASLMFTFDTNLQGWVYDTSIQIANETGATGLAPDTTDNLIWSSGSATLNPPENGLHGWRYGNMMFDALPYGIIASASTVFSVGKMDLGGTGYGIIFGNAIKYSDGTYDINWHGGAGSYAPTSGNYNKTISQLLIGYMASSISYHIYIDNVSLYSPYAVGVNNIFIGNESGKLNVSGISNVGLGSKTLMNNLGNMNTALGYKSFSANNGNGNIGLGTYAGHRQTSKSNLLIIDSQLRSASSVELTNAIIVGEMAPLPANQRIRINAKIKAEDSGVPLTVISGSSQTGNLQEWQSSASVVLARVDQIGRMYAVNLSGSNTGDQVVPLNVVKTSGCALVAYNSTTGSFTSGSLVSAIYQLSDVVITGSQLDGQALSWSSASSKWYPKTTSSGIGDAPVDGQIYGRQSASWVVITSGSSGGITEAPIDGQTYGRNSASWVVVTGGSSISSASSVYLYDQKFGETMTTTGSYFTSASTFIANSLRVFLNGVRQDNTQFTEGATHNYFTTAFTTSASDILEIDYSKIDSPLVISGKYNEVISGSGTSFYTSQTFIPNSLRVFLNGLRQDVSEYSEKVGLNGFDTIFTVYSTDVLSVDYDRYTSSGSAILPITSASQTNYWINGYNASTGSFTSASPVFASTSLNNLSTTSINANLIPDTTNTRALGSGTAKWATSYVTNGLFYGFLSTITGGVLTISSGSITITASRHTVDTEGAAATDDLVNIVDGGSNVGTILILSTYSSERDVTLKDGTGNMHLNGDCTLATAFDTIMLIKINSTTWSELCRSING